MLQKVLYVVLMLTLVTTVGVSAQEGRATVKDHFSLPEDAIYPEGIAYDANQHVFFVGSAVDGSLWRGDLATGEVTLFVEAGKDGNSSVTGMKVDTQGRLWVAGAETGTIFVYDAVTAERLQTYQVPEAKAKLVGLFTHGAEVPANLVNDITIAPTGDVYLTDSYSDLIYRIPSPEDAWGELEVWLTETGGGFINGITVTPDGKYLLIALAESGGLRRVEIETQEISEVILADGYLFPDGLIFDGEVLYAANFSPEGLSSIARILFTADDYSEGRVEPTFIVDETFAVATTLAIVQERLLVVNSQMFTYFDPDVEPLSPWIISNIELPEDS